MPFSQDPSIEETEVLANQPFVKENKHFLFAESFTDDMEEDEQVVQNNFKRAVRFLTLEEYDFNSLDNEVKKPLEVLLNIHGIDSSNETESEYFINTSSEKQECLLAFKNYLYPFSINNYELMYKIKNNIKRFQQIRLEAIEEAKKTLESSKHNTEKNREQERFIKILKPEIDKIASVLQEYTFKDSDYVYLDKEDLKHLAVKTNKDLYLSKFYPETHEYLKQNRISIAHINGIDKLARSHYCYVLMLPALFEVKNGKTIELIDPEKIEIIELPFSTLTISYDFNKIVITRPQGEKLRDDVAYLCLDIFNDLKFVNNPNRTSICCYQFSHQDSITMHIDKNAYKDLQKSSEDLIYTCYRFNILDNLGINSSTLRDSSRFYGHNYYLKDGLKSKSSDYFQYVNEHREAILNRVKTRITEYVKTYKHKLQKDIA